MYKAGLRGEEKGYWIVDLDCTRLDCVIDISVNGFIESLMNQCFMYKLSLRHSYLVAETCLSLWLLLARLVETCESHKPPRSPSRGGQLWVLVEVHRSCPTWGTYPVSIVHEWLSCQISQRIILYLAFWPLAQPSLEIGNTGLEAWGGALPWPLKSLLIVMWCAVRYFPGIVDSDLSGLCRGKKPGPGSMDSMNPFSLSL